ncbi:hypothetical protein LIER_13460 [Lithospermum erythrorhizon]|uniref:Uncharacterized protein n=1 Tax=Lithospermum erythrorhizon TaxID=34254 RepID=A0AAV3PXP8_LITER
MMKREWPSFSVGLTQLEEEESERGGGKTESRGGNEPKDCVGRTHHHCKPGQVFEVMQEAKGKENAGRIIEKLQSTGFGGLIHICNWKKIHSSFVEWVIKNFEQDGIQIRLSKTKVLKLAENDVHLVYHLPRGGMTINMDECRPKAIHNLLTELKTKGEYGVSLPVKDLRTKLTKLTNPIAWTKAVILYIMNYLLCPSTSTEVNLQYAVVLQDVTKIKSYNWCKHVLEHVKDGISQKNKKNPMAEFHLILINYLERTGKDCPFITGIYKSPSLCDWDLADETKNLTKIMVLVGLERGVTVGYTKERSERAGPVVVSFDAENCPIIKAPKYANYCRQQIEVYINCLTILKRRMEEFDEQGQRSREEKEDEDLVDITTSVDVTLDENDDRKHEVRNSRSTRSKRDDDKTTRTTTSIVEATLHNLNS